MSDLISRSELIKHFEAIQQQENVVGLEFIAMIDEIKEQPTAFDVQTKEIKWISVEDRLPDDGDSRFYMCLVENHLEDPPMFCQYEEERGFGFWNDIYDPVTLGFVDSEFQTMEELHYEKVRYWMPLIEPPEDEEEEDERYEIN